MGDLGARSQYSFFVSLKKCYSFFKNWPPPFWRIIETPLGSNAGFWGQTVHKTVSYLSIYQTHVRIKLI